MTNVVVNALGDTCPIPVVKTIKALKEIKKDSIIEIHVDNETAVENVMKLLSGKKFKPVSEKWKEDDFVIRAEVINPLEQVEVIQEVGCIPNLIGNTVVAIESEMMGSGDDSLGKILMKGFIYAISQLEELPKTIIFYNSAAKLTLNNSPTLEDIKNLEDQGVEVLTCGTCLDFFDIKEKLAVGSVSNMYTIVERLNDATKVIKP